MAESLHSLKDKEIKNKSQMVAMCRQVLSDIDTYIEVTYAAAPVRSQDPKKNFHLVRGPRSPTQKEAKLEDAVWEAWQLGSSARRDLMLPGIRGIVNYQFPLLEHRGQGWRMIDLVGATDRGLPAVIELKIATSDEAPGKILVQAAAYAIALKKAWEEGEGLRREWKSQVLDAHFGGKEAPDHLDEIPLICLADKRYWDRWKESLDTEAFAALQRLADAFGERGYPVTFASVSLDLDVVDLRA